MDRVPVRSEFGPIHTRTLDFDLLRFLDSFSHGDHNLSQRHHNQGNPPPGVKFSYGTAGFRADGSILASTVFRSGILAALGSLKTCSTVGLMITASHNPIADNGVKVADATGGMLTQEWEPFADALVNAANPEQLVQLVVKFVEEEEIPFGGLQSAEVLLGRDTRPIGESLIECAKHGIDAILGAASLNMGILTTPQLHWMVRCRNKGINASESDYFKQLSKAFRNLMDLPPTGMEVGKVNKMLLVDAANGVGGQKLCDLSEFLVGVELNIRNAGSDGTLNDRVGADFVQKEKVAPLSFGPDDVGIRCASLDSDADMLVYFRVLSTENNKIDLVDGDKILSLFALFIKEQLDILNRKATNQASYDFPVKIGVVQTAYANGASTDYLRHLGLDVAFTPTGVKYLHEKASEYDIGIYFEANGHGKANEITPSSTSSEHGKVILRLFAISELVNQAVGDAFSGLLLVEAILQYLGWTFEAWSRLYDDLPSRQLKLKIVDRTVVITAEAETQVVSPSGLQELINSETCRIFKRMPNILKVDVSYGLLAQRTLFVFTLKHPHRMQLIASLNLWCNLWIAFLGLAVPIRKASIFLFRVII